MEEEYNKSIELYNSIVKNISNYDKEQFEQTDTQPMHPNLYYQLCTVQEFTNLNGKTYTEYIDIWKSCKRAT